VPGALADALGRFAGDAPARREEVSRQALEHVTNWCGPEQVRQVLAAEVERLAASGGYRAAA